MEERYRLMFVFRNHPLSMLYCLGMDYDQGAMFCVMLYSPSDDVQLDYNTSHYPAGLVDYLKREKFKIDHGLYDIKMWKMDLYDKC
ncbi:hypothetical protein [Metabacillus fastidiosus]|uniref:hypothetical protein n=1 Tax=Metabacillus fastidiosus TaxID=1458 RepID=UPI002DC02770|nr:hypothetical protein [Metabacillus fastidiosus]MEC2076106.1 hypothetical protein [Metabacillus fastidiosus]